MFLLVCIWIGKMSSRAAAVVATIVAHHGSPLVSWTNMSSASHFAIGQPKNHPPARSLASSLTAAAAASATASLGGGSARTARLQLARQQRRRRRRGGGGGRRVRGRRQLRAVDGRRRRQHDRRAGGGSTTGIDLGGRRRQHDRRRSSLGRRRAGAAAASGGAGGAVELCRRASRARRGRARDDRRSIREVEIACAKPRRFGGRLRDGHASRSRLSLSHTHTRVRFVIPPPGAPRHPRRVRGWRVCAIAFRACEHARPSCACRSSAAAATLGISRRVRALVRGCGGASWPHVCVCDVREPRRAVVEQIWAPLGCRKRRGRRGLRHRFWQQRRGLILFGANSHCRGSP